MTDHVVVTGGLGFIGRHCAAALLDRGASVTVIDNFDPFYAPASKELAAADLTSRGATLIQADIRRPAAIRAAIRSADAVVHLAARAGVAPSVRAADVYHAINVEGTESLLRVCRSASLRRFVFASSSSVYGLGPTPFREADPLDPRSPYAQTKVAGERLVEGFGRDTDTCCVALRLFSVVGPDQRPDQAFVRIAGALVRGEPIHINGLATRRDFTHVADVVDALMSAVSAPALDDQRFHCINIGTGRTHTVREVVDRLASAFDTAPVNVTVGPRPDWDLPVTCADWSLAARLLGWSPRISLEAGIAAFATWFEEKHGTEFRPAARAG